MSMLETVIYNINDNLLLDTRSLVIYSFKNIVIMLVNYFRLGNIDFSWNISNECIIVR